MLLGFRTKLKLNLQQRKLMAQHAGYSRWVYNWGLATLTSCSKKSPDLSGDEFERRVYGAQIRYIFGYHLHENIIHALAPAVVLYGCT